MSCVLWSTFYTLRRRIQLLTNPSRLVSFTLSSKKTHGAHPISSREKIRQSRRGFHREAMGLPRRLCGDSPAGDRGVDRGHGCVFAGHAHGGGVVVHFYGCRGRGVYYDGDYFGGEEGRDW